MVESLSEIVGSSTFLGSISASMDEIGVNGGVSVKVSIVEYEKIGNSEPSAIVDPISGYLYYSSQFIESVPHLHALPGLFME